MQNKKKVLILGGAGFIGYYLTERLTNNGHEVVIYDQFINFLDHEKSHYREYLADRLKELYKRAKVIHGDIRDTAKLTQVLREFEPDSVVMLAAIPLATVCNAFASEAMDINLNGTMSILRALGNTETGKHLIFSSSSFVYGNFQYVPCDEKHPLNPIDVYGGTKLASESVIRGFCTRYGRDYTIIRPSAVYGPLDANRRVSQIFVENALQHKPLVIHDGEASLDFSYVTDVAQGFYLAITNDKAKNEIFNITRGEGKTLREFAEILKRYIPELEVTVSQGREDEKRPLRGSLDISKARELLGYNPEYSLEKGLEVYINFLRARNILSSK